MRYEERGLDKETGTGIIRIIPENDQERQILYWLWSRGAKSYKPYFGGIPGAGSRELRFMDMTLGDIKTER